jgi:hypothetical protein
MQKQNSYDVSLCVGPTVLCLVNLTTFNAKATFALAKATVNDTLFYLLLSVSTGMIGKYNWLID